MSGSIDERVLSLRFDNKGFGKSVDKTIDQLEKFEEALEFEDSSKGLDALQDKFRDFSVDGFVDGFNKIGNKISAVEQIAENFIRKFSYDLYNKLTGLIKSVSVDQISFGYSKYESQVKSVYTISTATGKTVEETNQSLDRLLWFTDETSYSFADMVNNIGKFTSQGVDLDDSIQAMEGIALAAAKAGQGTGEASRAMYNFAQALGTGSVKLIDWKSIENANMATEEFKNTIIEAAIAEGSLREGGLTKRGTKVTATNFSSTLAEGWFDSKTLLRALKRYGSYADTLYEYIQTHDVDTASQAIKELGDAGNEFGRKAFEAGQQARSLTDAIEATKDAVSSQWLTTFSYVIGNTDEATELFTDLANALWDVFAASGETRNELLSLWKENDGRTTLLEGIYDALEGIASSCTAVKEAFTGMFPEFEVDNLLGISNAVKDFGNRLKETYWYVDKYAYKRVENTGLLPDLKSFKQQFNDLLKSGADGELVKYYQQQLIDLGYDLGDAGADGIFGPKTEAAIKKFQQEAKIAVTGIYDEATNNAVGDALFSFKGDIKSGDSSSSIKLLQKRLLELDYDLGEAGADGIFGPKTEEALKKFQKETGIAITGVYDEATSHSLSEALLGTEETTKAEYVKEWVGRVYSPALAPLAKIAEGAGAIGNLARRLGLTLWESLKDTFSAFKPIVDVILDIAVAVSEFFIAVDEGQESQDFFDSLASVLKTFNSGLASALQVVADILKAIFLGPGSLEDGNPKIKAFAEWVERLKNLISNSKIGKWFKNLGNSFKEFSKSVSSKGFIATIKEKATKLWTDAKTYFTSGQFIADAKQVFKGVSISIVDFIVSLLTADDEDPDKKAAHEKSIREKIKAVLNRVRAFFRDVQTKIDEVVASIKDSPAIQWIKTKYEELRAKLSSFFSGLSGGEGDNLESTAGKSQSVLDRIRETITNAWNSVIGFFKSIFGLNDDSQADVSEVDKKTTDLDGIAETIKNLWNSVVGMFRWLFFGDGQNEQSVTKQAASDTDNVSFFETLKNIFGAIGSAITGFIAWWNENSVGEWIPFLVGFGVTVLMFFKVLGVIQSFLKTKQPEKTSKTTSFLKVAGSILMIAGAIAIVAYSIKCIGELDSGVLAQGSIVIGVVLGVLLGIVLGVNKMKIDKTKIFMFTGSLLMLAGAVAIISFVAWLIGNANFVKMIRGFVFLGVVIGLLLGFYFVMTKMEAKPVQLTGLLELAGAIAILVIIAWLVGNANWKKMLRGIGFIGLIMVLLAGFTILLTKTKSNNGLQTGGLILLASAIAILAAIAIVLGMTPVSVLKKGGIAILALMVMLAGMALVLKYTGGVGFRQTSGLLVIAGVLLILTLLVVSLSVIPSKKLKLAATVLGLLSIIVVAITAMAIIASKVGVGNMAKGAAGIAVAVGVFVVIIGALLAIIGALDEIGGGGFITSKITTGANVVKTMIDLVRPLVENEKSLKMIVGFLAVAAIIGKAHIGGSIIGGAAAIAATFDAVILILGALFAGLGVLNQKISEWTGGTIDIESAINEGGKIMSAIGRALASIATGAIDELSRGLTDFSGAMDTLRKDLAGYNDDSDTVISDVAAAWRVARAMRNFARAQIEEEQTSDYKNYFDLAAEWTETVSSSIGSFGTAIGKLREGVEGLGSDEEIDASTTRAVEIATKVNGFFTELEPYDYIWAPSGGIVTSPDMMNKALGDLGMSMSAYRFGVGGLSATNSTVEADTTKAIGILEDVKGFFDKVGSYEKTTTSKSAALYASKIDTFTEDLGILGDSFSHYKTSIEGAADSSVIDNHNTAIKVFEDVKAFMDQIGDLSIEKNPAKILRPFVTRTSFLTVIENASILADGLRDVKNRFRQIKLVQGVTGEDGVTKDIGFETAIDTAYSMAEKVADLMNKISNMPNIETNPAKVVRAFANRTAFATVLENAGELASKIVEVQGKFNDAGFEGGSDSKLPGQMKVALDVLGSTAEFMDKVEGYENIQKEQGFFAGIWDNLFGEKSIFETVLNGVGKTATTISGLQTTFDSVTIDENMTSKFESMIGMLNQVADLLVRIYGVKINGNVLSDIDYWNFMDSLEVHMLSLADLTEDPRFGTFTTVTNTIATGYTNVLDAITELGDFVAGKQLITDVTSYYNQLISNLTEGSETPKDGSSLSLLPTVGGFTDNSEVLTDAVSAVVASIVSVVRNYYSSMYQAGSFLVSGLANGINSNKSKGTAAGSSLASAILQAIKDGLQEKSPSKATYEMGTYLDEGLAQGMAGGERNMRKEALGTVGGMLAALSTTLSEGIDTTPTIRPVLDLSDVNSNIGLLDGYLADRSLNVRTSSQLASSVRSGGSVITSSSGSGSSAAAAIADLKAEVVALRAELGKMQVVMDGGALVGQIGPKMDGYLGHRAAQERRRGG